MNNLKESREVDTLRQIEGIMKAIQRKAQAAGAVGKKRWYPDNESLKYLSHEIDNIYSACSRVLREFGGSK